MAFVDCKITAVRPEGDGAVAVTLDAPFEWIPGQYVTLRTWLKGDEVRRSYSIAACPGAPLTVGIRAVPGGRFASWAQGLSVGDTLQAMPPEGRFCLRGENSLLLVAAGSGITPIVALAQDALDRGAGVTLVYGNRSSGSIMFRRALENLKDRYIDRFRLIHVLSREAQDVPVLNGRIDLENLASAGVIETDFEGAYLCGPYGMTEACRAALTKLGMAPERIHTELFSTDGAIPAAPQPQPMPEGTKVEVVLDGVCQSFVLQEDDASVVEAAARAGIELPWSCKGGMCCTCRCQIAEGAAKMAVNYSLEPWEIAAGFTLACQARPTSEKLVLDFDAT